MADNIKHLSLYHFKLCPFCIMTRRGIKKLDLDIELRDINKHPQHRKALLKGGGKAQVPCLRIENQDGKIRWLYESQDIIRYLSDYKRSQTSAA